MKFLKKLTTGGEVIIQNLSPIDISNLYLYLYDYENEIKGAPGSFDITNKMIDEFIKKHDIYLDTCNKKKLTTAKKHKFYFLFDQQKNSKVSKDDKAHHLLRHIRNSIAHCLIKRNDQNSNVYEMTDSNGHRNTMYGYINTSVFYQLITLLIQSKHK